MNICVYVPVSYTIYTFTCVCVLKLFHNVGSCWLTNKLYKPHALTVLWTNILLYCYWSYLCSHYFFVHNMHEAGDEKKIKKTIQKKNNNNRPLLQFSFCIRKFPTVYILHTQKGPFDWIAYKLCTYTIIVVQIAGFIGKALFVFDSRSK